MTSLLQSVKLNSLLFSLAAHVMYTVTFLSEASKPSVGRVNKNSEAAFRVVPKDSMNENAIKKNHLFSFLQGTDPHCHKKPPKYQN